MRRFLLVLCSLVVWSAGGEAQPINPGGGGGGSSGPSTYLGNIATNVGIGTQTSGSGNSLQTRSPHIAWDNVSSLAIVVPNWFANSATGETSTGGTMGLTAAIEYPVGTFTQVKWGGSASTNVAPLTTSVSDTITLPTSIPKGATFYVRMHALMAAGAPPLRHAYGPTVSPTVFGNNLPDQTMGGTISLDPTYSNFYWTPAAVIANTTIPSVLAIGDSRVEGLGDQADSGVNDIGEIEKGLSKGVPVINLGVGGESANQFPMTLRAAFQQYVTHIVCEYGSNNFITGQTLAQLMSNLEAVYALFPNKPIFQTTLTPITTSTDNWLTVANQTPGGGESIRTAFNTQIRNYGMPGTAGIFDSAHCVETSAAGTTAPVENGGRWMADGTVAGKYTPDGLHELFIANDEVAKFCMNFSKIRR